MVFQKSKERPQEYPSQRVLVPTGERLIYKHADEHPHPDEGVLPQFYKMVELK
jgi:hypothetical protein